MPTSEEWKLKDRTSNYGWGVAPFPSAVTNADNVCYANFDAMMIPAGDNIRMKPLNSSPMSIGRTWLKNSVCSTAIILSLRVSDNFLNHHPNPYVAIYQQLAASPNARCVPICPIWLEVYKELLDSAQAVTLGEDPEVAP